MCIAPIGKGQGSYNHQRIMARESQSVSLLSKVKPQVDSLSFAATVAAAVLSKAVPGRSGLPPIGLTLKW